MADKVIDNIKIKQSADNSFSDPYYFGVKGQNVQLTEGKDLETKLAELVDQLTISWTEV